MPRIARPLIAAIPYHIIHRGNNKQIIFFKDEDYSYFLELIGEGKEKYPVKIYSYILMTNHFHLMIEPRERESLPYFMRYVCAKYVQYINRHYHRSGTLWEGRYKSSIVGSDRYFLATQRYIETNPLRAGMVSKLEEYPWSSYLYYAWGKTNRLIDENPWYESLDKTVEVRQKAYRKFFKETIPDYEWELIRETVKKQVIYGDNRFKQAIEEQLKRKIELRQRGRPRNQQ